MKRLLSLLCAVLLIVVRAYAQDGPYRLRILDGYSTAPVAGVKLIDKVGTILATSDTAGYATLPSAAFKGFVVAIGTGYKPDTLYRPTKVVYLQKLSSILEEAVVRSAKVRKLLQEPREYVVDYAFAGDRLLVATYSGNGGKNAKLFLVDRDGNELGTCKVPYEPEALFKSCIGNHYCVCNDRFYPLTINDNGVSLKQPYAIDLLNGLQQCECAAGGNYFYRMGSKTLFRMLYGVLRKGDSVMKPITWFEERNVAIASMQETQDILALLAFGNFNEAARRQLLQKKWDYGSYNHINIPLFVCNDTVVIFDYFKKSFRYYDLDGNPTGSCPLAFEWRQSQLFEILQDDATGLLYIHRFDNQSKQSIELLNIQTGTTSRKTFITKALAERVKMHNGNIYFLWQQPQSGQTRQVFMQQTDL